MAELISNEFRTARKDHICEAWIHFTQSDHDESWFTDEERKQVAVAREQRGLILKGMRYINQVVKHEGEMCRFKCRPEIHAICIKYDLYPED